MNSNLMLLGISGAAGSGKDTVGDWFAKRCGFQKVAIASNLKAGLAAMGLPEPESRELKEANVPGFGFSWRHAAQALGTEWGRNLDEDLWLKLAELRIKHLQALGTPTVVTDIRFENEATMIRRLGGCIVHIQGRKVELGNLGGHASEQGVVVARGDTILHNDGSIQELESKLEGLIYG